MIDQLGWVFFWDEFHIQSHPTLLVVPTPYEFRITPWSLWKVGCTSLGHPENTSGDDRKSWWRGGGVFLCAIVILRAFLRDLWGTKVVFFFGIFKCLFFFSLWCKGHRMFSRKGPPRSKKHKDLLSIPPKRVVSFCQDSDTFQFQKLTKRGRSSSWKQLWGLFFWGESILELQFWCITTDLVAEICLEGLGSCFVLFSTWDISEDLYRLLGFWIWYRSSDGGNMHISQTELAGGFIYFWWLSRNDPNWRPFFSNGLVQLAASLVKTVNLHSPRADRYKWSDMGSPYKWPKING